MPANPYVGPRSFQPGERLYGRDREAAELQDLLIAERIVLLYSPSGAGKTSLLQAKLLPAMAASGFAVRPILRPGAEPSAAGGNRFVQACLDSFPQFLAKPDASEILVFDQFEEVLTVDAGNREAKADFFKQLGEALRVRNRWALFAMREDYIAGLDPYLKLVPTRLAATYRLDLLDRERAIDAIREPARAAGVDFTLPAAGKLADDLRRGGPYVEPVQLQVVCLRLWDKPRPNQGQLAESDVGGAGDIDQALADYYADCVTKTVSPAAPERAIRDWFDRRLISKEGTRTQVLRGADQGLDGDAIAALVNRHLVRSDQRNETTWYELAHDRMIAPVQENNRQWREANLSPLQRQAELWDEQKRPDGALLSGAALSKVEVWARRNPNLTAAESDFLAACRAQRVRHNWQRAGVILIAALAIAALAAFFQASSETRRADRNADDATKSAASAKRNAEDATTARRQAEQNRDDATDAAKRAALAEAKAVRQATIATSALLASNAISRKDTQTELASLLAVEAFHTADRYETRNALLTAAQSNPSLMRSLPQPGFGAAAFSSDGQTIATAGVNGAIQLWNAAGDRFQSFALPDSNALIESIAFLPKSKTVAAVDDRGGVTLISFDGPKPVVRASTNTGGRLTTVAVSADGARLAFGGANGAAQLWDVAAWKPVAELKGHVSGLARLAFNPQGTQLASVSEGTQGLAIVWDARTGRELRRTEYGFSHDIGFAPDGSLALAGDGLSFWKGAATDVVADSNIDLADVVYQTAFDNTGVILAAAGSDHAVTLVNLTTRQRIGLPLMSRPHDVVTVSFSPDGRRLLAGDILGAVLWSLDNEQPLRHELAELPVMKSLAFTPNGELLAQAGPSDNRVTDLTTGKSFTLPRPPGTGGARRAESVAISPDGKTIATAATGVGGRIWVSGLDGANPTLLNGHSRLVTSLAFSPDGKTLASASYDQTICLWDWKNGRQIGPALSSIPGGPTAAQKNSGTNLPVHVAFRPDGKVLAVGDGRGQWAWELPARKPWGSVAIETNRTVSVSIAFSPDGATIAVGAGEDIVLRDARTGDIREAALEGHSGNVTGLAFSPDSSLLVSTSGDGTVRIWDVAARRPLGLPLGGSTTMFAAAFSPNGKTLAVSSSNDVFLWDASPDAWVARDCARANRNLTREEWKDNIGADVPYRQTCAQFPAGEGDPHK